MHHASPNQARATPSLTRPRQRTQQALGRGVRGKGHVCSRSLSSKLAISSPAQKFCGLGSSPLAARVSERRKCTKRRFALKVSAMAIPVTTDDTVAVVGASGNVGRLVALRLADKGYNVRALARNPEKAKAFLDGGNNSGRIQYYACDTLKKGSKDLETALTGVNCIIMCTGVSAFPTANWGELTIDLQAEGGIWQKFHYSNAVHKVDADGPQNVLEAWCKSNDKSTLKRFLLMSSVGVTRRDSLPYSILNGAGVLDAKAAGESALKKAAEDYGFDWTVARPGQLFGGPYSSAYYLGTLFQLEKDSNNGRILLEKGDTIVGDTIRSSLAEVLSIALSAPGAANTDFGVVNEVGEASSPEEVAHRFESLDVPETKGIMGPRIDLFLATLQQASGKVGSAWERAKKVMEDNKRQ
mmetsp:Transcript_1599/g.5579  ORF Transcript_1599/g.5579 Transcript_1599/m.5579 type:complete len:412 (-) Transcript_1599:485-1720(-)